MSSSIVSNRGFIGRAGFEAPASQAVVMPPVPIENFSSAFSMVGIMPKTPMEPVMVAGSATILLPARLIQ